MARRYTDTDKWKDDWYLSLNNDMRIVWQYLVDNCSIAGIWKKGFTLLNIVCNTRITEEEFKQVFTPRVIDCGTFYFIPKFLKFQYPLGLTSDKPMIISVMKEVSFFNLSGMITESLGNDYPIITESLSNDSRIIKVISNSNKVINKKVTSKKIKEDSHEKKIPPSCELAQEYFFSVKPGHWNDEHTKAEVGNWFDHYEANGWKVGKNPMKDWKASVRTWIKNDYNFQNSTNGTSRKNGTHKNTPPGTDYGNGRKPFGKFIE